MRSLVCFIAFLDKFVKIVLIRQEGSPQLAGQPLAAEPQPDSTAEGSDAIAWLQRLHGGNRMTEDAVTHALPKRHLAKVSGNAV